MRTWCHYGLWAVIALWLAPEAAAEPSADVPRAWPLVLLASVLFTIGVYHLQIFLRRRKSAEDLWFALSIFLLVAVVALEWWTKESALIAPWLGRAREAAMHLVLPVLIQLAWVLLSRPMMGWSKAYLASQVGLAAAVCIIPTPWLVASHTWRWLWGIPGWVLLVVICAGALRQRVLESRVIGLGGILLAFVGLVGWGGQVLGREWMWPLPWPSWIAAALALVTAQVLSWRSRRIQNELEELRSQLEEMVEDRTQELESANDRLQTELAEQRLAKEAMRMLERGVEQSIDGIVVTDTAGEVRFANRAWAKMHGCQVVEILGRRLGFFHTPEQMEKKVEPCLEQVERVGSFQGEIEHVRKDGTTFPTWTTVTLLTDPEEGPVGFVFVGRDISERKRSEIEQRQVELRLRQAKRLESLGNLACAIANDYNNMLTPVIVNTSVLMRDLEPTSASHDRVRLIEAAADRAADLSNQLLAYAGEDPKMAQEIDLGDLIQEMRPELEQLLPAGADLRLRLSDQSTPVAADPAQARRLIRNLAANAAEALDGAPGTVTLRTWWADVEAADLVDADLDEAHDPGRYVLLEVADSGRGMPDDVRKKIFEPFFSTRPSASGLGLAAVFGIVRGHRGALKVRSRPGSGTSVRVLFPILESTEKIVVHPPVPAIFPNDAEQGKVLVVDDEELIREVSEWILEEGGYQVVTAADGVEALELFRRDSDRIRVVLLDNHMPKMNGRAVLEELRRLEPAARVILMSGFPEKEVTASMDGLGLSGFLKKPFRPHDLMGKVRQVLGA